MPCQDWSGKGEVRGDGIRWLNVRCLLHDAVLFNESRSRAESKGDWLVLVFCGRVAMAASGRGLSWDKGEGRGMGGAYHGELG